MAVEEVRDGGKPVGYALITAAEWTLTGDVDHKSRPIAEVLLERLDRASGSPDDGLIAAGDPGYQLLAQGQLLWSGELLDITWLSGPPAHSVYGKYF